MTSSSRILRDAALAAVGRGWRIFPVQPGGKTPAVPNHRADRCRGTGRCAVRHQTWEDLATADLEVVDRAWSGCRGECNIGGACGPSGLVGLDLDAHGELPADWAAIPGLHDGRDVLAQLCEWAGQPWPATHMASTPSGGWHLVYRAPADGRPVRNSQGALGPSIDVRGVGGFLVLPGSVVNGRRYELLDDSPPTPLPAWLAKRLQPQPAPASCRAPAGGGPANLRGLVEVIRNSKPGDRTGPLVWAAHRLAEKIAAGRASAEDGEMLVQAAVAAGDAPKWRSSPDGVNRSTCTLPRRCLRAAASLRCSMR